MSEIEELLNKNRDLVVANIGDLIEDKFEDAWYGKLKTSIISPEKSMLGFSQHVNDGRTEQAYKEFKSKWLEKVSRDYPKHKVCDADFLYAHEIVNNAAFDASHYIRKQKAEMYHRGEITYDECTAMITDQCEEYFKEIVKIHCSGIALGMAYFSSVECFKYKVPLSLFGPLSIEILRHAMTDNDARGVELLKLFYITHWNISHSLLDDLLLPQLVSRNVGQKGGRPKHLRKEEALRIAQVIIERNESASLSDISSDVLTALRSKYHDYPKYPTIKNWVSQMDHFKK